MSSHFHLGYGIDQSLEYKQKLEDDGEESLHVEGELNKLRPEAAQIEKLIRGIGCEIQKYDQSNNISTLYSCKLLAELEDK